MKYLASIVCMCLLLIFFSCQKSNRLIVGAYNICEPTTYEWLVYQNKGVHSTVAGSHLLLRLDSTFTYITCGNVMTGTWQTHNQALLLQSTSNRYRIDSLNLTHNCTIRKEPLQYEMEGNKLYRLLSFTSGPSLELLSKK